MKATIMVSALAAAVRRVGAAAQSKATVPVLQTICIETGGGELVLRATDMEHMATEVVPAEIEAAGGTCLPAHKLAAFVGGLDPDSEVRLSVGPQGNATLIQGGNRARIAGMSPAEFPAFPLPDDSVTFAVDRAELLDQLERLGRAVSTEETRYYLNGVHVVPVKGGLRLEATDGHRLHRDFIPVGGKKRDPKCSGFILPRATLGVIAKTMTVGEELELTVGPPGEPTTVEISVVGEGGGGRAVASKLIDGAFPDTDRVVNADREFVTVTVARGELTALLSRVAGFAISGDKGRCVAFRVSEDRLVVAGHDAGGDVAIAELTDVGIEGAQGITVSGGFNERYMRSALQHVGEEVELHIERRESIEGAIHISAPGEGAGADRLAVVMPVRAGWPGEIEEGEEPEAVASVEEEASDTDDEQEPEEESDAEGAA